MSNKETFPLAILGIDYLIPTNPNLDLAYIDFLVEAIKTGKINPMQEASLFVGVKKGLGYYVNDGNHHYAAYMQAGVKAALSEVYSLRGNIVDSVDEISANNQFVIGKLYFDAGILYNPKRIWNAAGEYEIVKGQQRILALHDIAGVIRNIWAYAYPMGGYQDWIETIRGMFDLAFSNDRTNIQTLANLYTLGRQAGS